MPVLASWGIIPLTTTRADEYHRGNPSSHAHAGKGGDFCCVGDGKKLKPGDMLISHTIYSSCYHRSCFESCRAAACPVRKKAKFQYTPGPLRTVLSNPVPDMSQIADFHGSLPTAKGLGSAAGRHYRTGHEPWVAWLIHPVSMQVALIHHGVR